HHDIYSIEDLAQLIFDLRCVNSKAQISVKLVSEVGVGTIAAGVVKGVTGADHVVIADGNGGTGASASSSLRYAGLPRELGVAETQQTLVRNLVREGTIVETDGQIKIGRDIVLSALLGADEFGISTWALVAEGCTMLGVCHQNTCKEGVATQDPDLRKNFQGKPEHVAEYMRFVVEDVRRIMASLGVRHLDDLVGRVDLLRQVPSNHFKAKFADLSRIVSSAHMTVPDPSGEGEVELPIRHHGRAPFDPSQLVDFSLVPSAKEALDTGNTFATQISATNQNRALGTYLSGEIERQFGYDLPDDSVTIKVDGRVGQSLGAWFGKGMTMVVEGSAQDYVGKGLSGGKLAVRPPDDQALDEGYLPASVGNVCLFGATSGELLVRGTAGERFAVRNSGAHAVIEGVGDHFCEYMTGGKVVNLGPVGLNAFAGMSGGEVFQLDAHDFDLYRRMNGAARNSVNPRDLTPQEEEWLYGMLLKQATVNKSPIAQDLVENWESAKKRFTKYIPAEYENALHKMKAKAARPEAPHA
ncbi:MAG: glutamate synthase subunit alpha, partial [Bdellovibrionales bacterium]|nr:glutamate synthase subunit alpha [Bdellovibrionales bacterium]